MSDEQTADAAATETQATDEQTNADEQKPTETVEFWKAKAREQEKRAKQNADAATRLAAFEQAQMTEAERASERAKVLEQENASLRLDALRSKVAINTGLPARWVDRLRGEDEASITADAQEILAEIAAQSGTQQQTRPPRPDPNQGRSGAAPAAARDQFGAWLNAT